MTACGTDQRPPSPDQPGPAHLGVKGPWRPMARCGQVQPPAAVISAAAGHLRGREAPRRSPSPLSHPASPRGARRRIEGWHGGTAPRDAKPTPRDDTEGCRSERSRVPVSPRSPQGRQGVSQFGPGRSRRGGQRAAGCPDQCPQPPPSPPWPAVIARAGRGLTPACMTAAQEVHAPLYTRLRAFHAT